MRSRACGPQAQELAIGDAVVLSWNPSCGRCFYCDRDLPILCEPYLATGAEALQFDGLSKARGARGEVLRHLMFIGGFAEFCIVQDRQAIRIPPRLPFDEACLIGCGVITGVGAALNVATIGYGDTVLVVGCGAVGLAAVQGAKLAGAGRIIAADLDVAKLEVARELGATHVVDARAENVAAAAKSLTAGRGADVVLESAGSVAAFRTTAEAVRPSGEIVWLGKVDVLRDVSFRWSSLMQEKRIRRSSYGGARPGRDFPLIAQAVLDGRLNLARLISARLSLADINDGFDALRAGRAIRSVVLFD